MQLRHLGASLAVFLLVYTCNCYQHDARFVNSENVTTLELMTRTMDVGLFKIPRIDESENEYIRHLAPKVLEHQRPFVFAHDGISARCRRDSQKFLSSLKKFDLWALKMYDASAKLSSGVLNGNVNRYGDFDQCLEVQADTFQGQYCLAYIQPTITSDLKYLNYLRTLVLSFESYKSTFDDERHVVPKTSQMNFAFCIPSTCTHSELELVLGENLRSFFNDTGLRMDVRVEPEMCQTNVNEPYSVGTKLSLLLVGFVVFISIYAAFYERSENPNKNEWLTSFSLAKNWKDLICIKPSNDIASAHGIRFLHTVMLIVSHKCMEIDFNPMPNRSSLAALSKSPMTVVVRASYLYTDTFIMLSSMLVTYSFVGRLNRGQKINVWKEIATRYFRVVPPMAALILFGTFILPILGSGPQWPLLISNQSTLCKTTWWRNFFMIHNWFGFGNICMTHTHHIGTDFELFLTAPFLVILLHKYPRKMSWGIFVAAALSTVGRYYVTYARNMTVFVLFGLDISKLYEIASYMYIIPFYRFTVYAMGIMLGYMLRTHTNVRLSNFQLICGWVISTTLFVATIFLTAIMSRYDYTFSAVDAANFSAIAPIPWCLFFAWIIYTSHMGYKNLFTQIFEWRGFLIATRLSYGIYLVQFAVFHYNIATVRNTEHFEFVKAVINTNEIFCIILAATVMTLFFDAPFGNLKKLIFDTKRAPQQSATAAADKKEPRVDMNANVIADHGKSE